MKKPLFFVLLILFTFLCTPSAWAAGGETCGEAVVATLGVNTVDGPDSGDGASACSGGINSEWFLYTATADGLLEVDNCGTDVDAVVYIHTTACGSEDCASGGDADGCPSENYEEYTAIYVTNGSSYLIEWTDAQDDSGFDWTLTFTPGGTPGGETCAEALAVTPGTHIATGPRADNGASSGCSIAECEAECGDTQSEWFSYTPTGDGTIDVGSCESGADTVLYIHSTSCGSEDCAAGGDDDACGYYAEEITEFSVTAGHTYYIEWTNYQHTSGFFWTLSFTPGTPGSVAAIPTMGEWGMIIMSLMLVTGGVIIMRRRQDLL